MQKANKYTSPFGKAIYPHLSRPDVRFKAEGEYKVDLEVEADEANDLVEKIKSWAEDSVKQAQDKTGKKTVKRFNTLPFKETEDGKVIFKFKMVASGTNSKTGDTFKQRPGLFDNELKPISPEINIWGGSILRVSFQPYHWYTPALGAGLSLKLKSAQVKDLIEGGNGSPANDFDKVEGDCSSKNMVSDDEKVSEEVSKATDF